MSNKKTETQKETVQITVTSETLRELNHLIRLRNWEPSEGYRIILGAGLGYLLAQSLSESENITGLPQDLERLTARLVETESMLASLRFRAFELQQQTSNWELSNGAVFQENMALKNLVKRQREEIADLRLKLKELQQKKAGDHTPSNEKNVSCSKQISTVSNSSSRLERFSEFLKIRVHKPKQQ
jgi:hypothetical protein